MKKMFITAVAVISMARGVLASVDIGEEFAKKESWSIDPVIFASRHTSDGFKFTSADRSSADTRQEGAVEFFGLKVYEATVSFSSDAVTKIKLSLYNKGGTEEYRSTGIGNTKVRVAVPAPKLDRSEFLAIIKSAAAKMSDGGKLPPPVDQPVKRRNFVQKQMEWPKREAKAVLSWSYYQEGKTESTFQPEYITLTIMSPVKQVNVVNTATATTPAAKNLRQVKQNVVKFPNGNVYIDGVPMVDQGHKGYCAAAVSERILRYYGLQFDEHEIAQLAGTTAESGTSAAAMEEAVTKIGSKFALRKETVIAPKAIDWQKDLQQYNNTAKAMKKKQLNMDDYVAETGAFSRSVNISKMWDDMEPEVRKASKCKLTGPMTKFKSAVKSNVDAGVPMFWGVSLGIYPEPEIPQARGGHMRIIIGYNAKTKEVLYTDTWGAGHELKRMPEDWAWAITDTLFCLRPRN